MNSYQQTLDYIFARLPMFSRIGAAAYRADLTNTIALCEALGNPQNHFKTIHIAGTNGKGSTSHMLAAALQSAGYKTGLYTSPHLKDFRERIRLNGVEIPEQFVIGFIERIKPLVETLEPSFFEITVAMAFDFFRHEQVDIAVIEVGLGGRLDSTNIILPEISVITNIGMDHMNMLGDTLEKIAFEKAGIIKPGIPVVVGETLPATRPVFEKRAAESRAPLYIATDHFWVTEWHLQPHRLNITVADKHTDNRVQYQLDLPGIYQLKNLLTVLEALRQLQQKGWNIPEAAVQKGVSQVKKLTGLHGRWELIHQHPDVVLDVAHNEDGIRQLVEQIEITDHTNLHIIIGMVKDKEIDHALALLPKQATYYFTKARIPRALPEEQLAQKAAGLGLRGQHYPDVNAALKQAMEHAGKNDLVLVCGSVFVIGEVNAAIFS
ncbi:MAG: bifunctional folylpolyglutamate synthase/dihydrofolate synthase [Bacteroidetes bacterium]|nr:bifunctional folylpolyglutamate synthase/dihydrofolate synthase [Bacteroidota bacterium]